MNDWDTYIAITANKPPRPLLIEAISLCVKRESALDLGAGGLNEARYLTEHGFKVVAIDSNPSVATLAGNLDVQIMRIEEYEYPLSSFDLVISLYTLPFIQEKTLPVVLKKITETLRVSGIFAAQFFGLRDSWSGRCITHTKDEIRNLVSGLGLSIIKLEEREYDQPTAAGKPKHWHVFEVIARKSTR